MTGPGTPAPDQVLLLHFRQHAAGRPSSTLRYETFRRSWTGGRTDPVQTSSSKVL